MLSGRHSEKNHRRGDVFIQQNKSSSSFQPFHTPSLVSTHSQEQIRVPNVIVRVSNCLANQILGAPPHRRELQSD